MDALPGYVSIVFILTTLATIFFLLRAVRAAGLHCRPAQILYFLIPLWIIFTGFIALSGFYQDNLSIPPRIAAFGVFPCLLLIISFFVFFRNGFIDRMPLKILTMVHVVRIPVEIVLLWLFIGGQVPRIMTFEGYNFDILSGILAPIVYVIAFRGGKANRSLLVAFNIFGLLLLGNIVSIAILSLPSPLQMLAFDQPNVAVTYFPFIWLPTIVVPIVFFSHLASLWKIAVGRDN
ncbi:hypothetical protein BH10ACI3_BH10ACI3_00610 [soil metagenome]